MDKTLEEIEITEEMIAAGVDAAAGHFIFQEANLGYPEKMIVDVYRAMVSASKD